MDRDIQRILLSREQICALVQTLARRIDSDYWGKKLFWWDCSRAAWCLWQI